MRRRTFLASLSLTGCVSAQVPAKPDYTVVLGKRVGAVGKFTTADMLSQVYGAKQVQHKKLPGPEGELYDASLVCAGTDRELHVVWDPEAVQKRVFHVELIGKAWVLESGLRLGLTVPEVQKINGAPFQLSGFDWDYGGYANIKEGKLASGVGLRFAPLEPGYDSSLSGDIQISSESPALNKAQAVVTELLIVFR